MTDEDDPELRSQQSKWLFTDDELHRSPSVQTGHTVERELSERGKGCEFIFKVCYKLRVPQQTISTACVFLHRFYMRHSLREYHYYEVAATCVFLATKCEETVRKLRDIVVACCQTALKNDRAQIDEQSKEYWRWRDVILYTEETLLEALCFDLNVIQPYASLKRFWRLFGADPTIARTAWAFANDSFRAAICVQYEPRTVAAAALHFASIFHDTPLQTATTVANSNNNSANSNKTNGTAIQSKLGETAKRRKREWYELCEVEITEVDRATERMVELYEMRGGAATHETAKAGLDPNQIVKAGSELVKRARSSHGEQSQAQDQSQEQDKTLPVAEKTAAQPAENTAEEGGTISPRDTSASVVQANDATTESKETVHEITSEPKPAAADTRVKPAAKLVSNGVHGREEETPMPVTGRRASKRLRGDSPTKL